MSKLRHPNIVPFLGIANVLLRGFLPLCVITPWMHNGDMSGYLRSNRRANRLALLEGVARALAYMHNLEPVAVHGDVKAANVLIDAEGTALLADFGLARRIDEILINHNPSSSYDGTPGFISPERLCPEQFGMERQSGLAPPADVFSFGMLIYESFTGLLPFQQPAGSGAKLKVNHWEIARWIGEGLRPTIPEAWEHDPIKSAISEIMDDCWSHYPQDRPTMDTVVEQLQELQVLQSQSLGLSQHPPTYIDPPPPWVQPAGMFPIPGSPQPPPGYHQAGPSLKPGPPQQAPGYGPPPRPIQ